MVKDDKTIERTINNLNGLLLKSKKLNFHHVLFISKFPFFENVVASQTKKAARI